MFSFDNSIRDKGYISIAGIDEAGRGPLAGPVIASAVILRKGSNIPGLDDSKKLNSKKIESLFWEITSEAESIGLGIVDSEEIDRLNILNATKKAMKIAVRDLNKLPDLIMIDALSLDDLEIDQMAIVKGDSKSASIAAASIVAKYIRDWMMRHYHTVYPDYGFNKHKGYGTRLHIDKINEYGPCPIHRRSFHPVSAIPLPF
ncbi:MAG: ribonuclease HII [Nitrospirota bacterium]|nr:MAG: ribonuclease HII [Nitrospirota bacterium]